MANVTSLTSRLPTIGFFGIGAMGLPMVRNLLGGGYMVRAFDLDPERLAAAVDAGASAAIDPLDAIGSADRVLTSLPSSDAFVRLADDVLLPSAPAGQIIIDLGTTTPPETRRIAAALAARGARLLDVPVSGGPGGVQRRALRMFAGGERATFDACRAMLETIGGADHLVHCGPSGAGQVVKGCNQLMMGLVVAAHTEAVAFGVNAGIDAAVVARAVGSDAEPWLRKDFLRVATRIASGEGSQLGVKFRELPYFLAEAEAAGFPLPLTKALHAFCDAGERVVVDDNRRAPSFFHELTRARPARPSSDGASR